MVSPGVSTVAWRASDSASTTGRGSSPGTRRWATAHNESPGCTTVLLAVVTADEWADQQAGRLAELIVEQDLAGFRALAEPDGFEFDFQLDELFEFGLGIVLDGLAVKLQRLRTPLR